MRLTKQQAAVLQAVLDGASSVRHVAEAVDWNQTNARDALMSIARKMGEPCDKVRDTFAVILSRGGELEFDIAGRTDDEQLREPEGIVWPDYSRNERRATA